MGTRETQAAPFNSVGEKCVECYLPNCDLNSDNMPGQVRQTLTSGGLKHQGCVVCSSNISNTEELAMRKEAPGCWWGYHTMGFIFFFKKITHTAEYVISNNISSKKWQTLSLRTGLTFVNRPNGGHRELL